MPSGPVPLSHVLGKNLAALRVAEGYTQEGLAQIASRFFALPWTRATVAAIETGRRLLPLEEILALAILFDRPLSALLDLHGQAALVDQRWQIPPETLSALTQGKPPGIITRLRSGGVGTYSLVIDAAVVQPVVIDRDVVQPDRATGQSEAERTAAAKLAKELRLRQTVVVDMGRELWGRDLAKERDRRLAEQPGRGSSAVRAGHITRDLIQELRSHLEATKAKGRKRNTRRKS